VIHITGQLFGRGPRFVCSLEAGRRGQGLLEACPVQASANSRWLKLLRIKFNQESSHQPAKPVAMEAAIADAVSIELEYPGQPEAAASRFFPHQALVPPESHPCYSQIGQLGSALLKRGVGCNITTSLSTHIDGSDETCHRRRLPINPPSPRLFVICLCSQIVCGVCSQPTTPEICS
jgi:hypothetical protein